MITKFEPIGSGLMPYRKEKGFFRQVSAVTKDGKEVLNIRFYRAGYSFYCCTWLYFSPFYVQAGAKDDGGMNYDKAESAMRNALRKMGIEFTNTHLDAKEVCEEISKHLGVETIVIDAHA